MDLATHVVHDDADQLADLQRKQEDQENTDDDNDDVESKKKKLKPSVASSTQIDTSYYDYLINMSLRNFTKERREEILKEKQERQDRLEALKKKSPEDLFEDDLLNFENEYRKVNYVLISRLFIELDEVF